MFFLCAVRRSSMCSTKKRILQSDSNPLRKLKAATTTRLWVALTIVFASWSPAAAAEGSTGKPQSQGGNLRIEFDNHLRSRVVARFDGSPWKERRERSQRSSPSP